ncbi:MAG: SGNH/GDSL hydrolase family protein [Candidatus Nanohaloarchaea archaeon]
MGENRFKDNKLLGSAVLIGTLFILGVSILVIGEIGVRMTNPQPIMPRYVTDAPYDVRMNMPDTKYQHKTPDYKVKFDVNSEGMRDSREFQYQKPENTTRIVVIGDSFTMGYGVNRTDLFTSVLERGLKYKERDVQVINLGVSGFGTAEELVTLKNKGLKYNPDLVIMAYYKNDKQNNIASGLYELKEGNLKRSNEAYMPKIELRNFLYSLPPYRYAAENSQLLYVARSKASSIIYKNILRKRSKDSSEEESSSNSEYREELTGKLIEKSYNITRDEGAEFLLVNIPDRDLETEPPLNHTSSNTDIKYFNSAETLRKAPEDQLLYWKKSQGHWTPYAQRKVGEDLIKRTEKILD